MIEPIFELFVQKTGDFWDVVARIEPEDCEVFSGALSIRGCGKFEVTACHSEDCDEYAVFLVDNMQRRQTLLRIRDSLNEVVGVDE